MIDKLKDTLNKIKPELIKRYGIKEIGVFGSVIRNESSETSDIDVLVDFDKTITLFKFAQMENYLSDILGKRVDLVMKSSLKHHIGKQILSEVNMI